MASCQGARPGAIPGNRTNSLNKEGRIKNEETFRAERQLAQLSLQNSMGLGQHQGGVPLLHSAFIIIPFFPGSWQTSNALALQAS
jgi:hypothetical protein